MSEDLKQEGKEQSERERTNKVFSSQRKALL